MLFNSAIFAIFFLAFYAIYNFIPLARRYRQWTITLGSVIFYAAWDVRFVPLLLGTALVDFFAARAMDRPGARDSTRRTLLVLSLTSNLGTLAFFKYANFLIGSTNGLLHLIGVEAHLGIMAITLPVGISFYTFQSMSYTIDVYRRELRARRHVADFLAAVTFFPHLVAGPIIRASTLLPQFERPHAATWQHVRRGFLLVSVGLAKKGIADHLGGTTDAFFVSGEAPRHDALASWTGTLAFTGQIYGDFSGYTDMAIGLALVLGFWLPVNFDYPYIALSPIEFWKRWHISLSTWLREYLYVPLGGNRAHHYRNLMLTMLLGGLWHGASWTFVAWGCYHGALLVAAHKVRTWRAASAFTLPRLLKRTFTFYLVVIGWVMFRSTTFGQAWRAICDMHGAGPAKPWDGVRVLTLALVLGSPDA